MLDKGYFCKDNEDDKIWWYDGPDHFGEFIFSFDRKKTYNLFADYPHNLSVQEWKTFNKENEYWAKFFRDRNISYALEHINEIDLISDTEVFE